MGQLLNRLRNFAKSQLRDDEPLKGDIADIDEDDELKKLIDEASKNIGKSTNTDTENFKNNISSEQEACSILGITATANIDEIKAAYKNLIKQYHPDKVADLGDEIKKVAEKKSTEINKAYEYLKKKRNF